ncbi:MAG: tetratricopeptide repeat protein [Aggregatilineales bacterium]
MYLRTPKRYRPGRPKRHLISTRWLWLWIVTPLVVMLGLFIYERREEYTPLITSFFSGLVQEAQTGLSTVTAPTPLPTTDPAQRLAMADSAWSRGAIEEALREYGAVIDSVPNDVQVHYRYTLGLIIQGRSSEALAAAERTLTANPFSSDAWAIRALALDRNGQPEQAIASALQALSINPRNARALAFMAEAYLDANRPELAAETVRRALDIDPDSYEANYVSGLINWQVRYDLQAARDDLRAAQNQAPNLPYIAVDRAWLEWNLGNYEVARELLQDVVELNPQNLDALYASAYLSYQAFGEPNRALDYLERCIQASPRNISCLSYLGIVRTALGDTQGAVEAYRALMQTETTNPSHFLNAGRAYINIGECSSAITLLQRGYDLERARAEPNFDRLAVIEALLRDCGVAVAPLFGPAPADDEALEEAEGS